MLLITVNAICPSYVKTPLVEMQISDQARENGIPEEDVINNIMLEPMPKKCFIEMDEIVAAVNYLMSSTARNISGHEIILDGGWTAR
ncbi:MAG: 3-hydroxybutyrate dehydrogenase [Halioglobus sp.]|jgi:3-hydroxybutyrate dehydrogenase